MRILEKSIKIASVIMFLLVSDNLYSQLPKISNDWKQIIFRQFEELKDSVFFNYDYSSVISNQMRMYRDPWSTYIGVFGPKNRRIDFQITASKSINKYIYSINGKSKLDTTIRAIKGEIKLTRVLKISASVYIMLSEFNIKEPGDIDGDGYFIGISSFLFVINNKKPKIFWSEAGEYREFNNMFVGTWNRYNSKVSLECIFSFQPSGTYTKLPFRDYKDFNSDDECKCYYEIKDEYRQFGWQDYKDNDVYKDKW